MGFYYGNSKKILSLPLSLETSLKAIAFLRDIIDIDEVVRKYLAMLNTIDIDNLQSRWLHRTKKGTHPHELVDYIGHYSQILNQRIKKHQEKIEIIVMEMLNDNSKKIREKSTQILCGVVLGGLFNQFVIEGGAFVAKYYELEEQRI